MSKTAAERKREQRLRDKENGLVELSIKVTLEDKELINTVGITTILEFYKLNFLTVEE